MTAVTCVDLTALQVWVEASCAEQGVPVHISDPVALASIGRLLNVGALPSLSAIPARV